MLIGNIKAQVVAVKGAFLKGDVKDGYEIHKKIHQGREHHYIYKEVLRLKANIKCLKQAAMILRHTLLECMKNIDRS